MDFGFASLTKNNECRSVFRYDFSSVLFYLDNLQKQVSDVIL